MAGQTSLVILNADRPRILKAGWREIAEFERITGRSLMTEAEEVVTSFSGIRAMAFSFLLQDAENHGEKLTIGKVGLEPGEVSVDAILDAASEAMGFNEVSETVMLAFQKFCEAAGKKAKKKAAAEKNLKAADPEQ